MEYRTVPCENTLKFKHPGRIFLSKMALSLALALGSYSIVETAFACTNTISSDFTLPSTVTCDYIWQAGNLTVSTTNASQISSLLGTNALNGANLVIDTNTSLSISYFLTNSLGSSIASIVNNGVVQGYYGIDNNGSIGTFVNNNVFPEIFVASSASVQSVTNNTGATMGGNYYPAIYNSGNIGTIVNLGTFTDGQNGAGIVNYGTIGVLINAQNNLIYGNNWAVGVLPQKYVTYFSSPTSFGKVSFNNLSSYSLASYGITWASGVSLVTGTYAGVITSDQALTVPGGTLTYNGVTYRLVARNGSNLIYDLVIDSVPVVSTVTAPIQPVSQPSVYSAAASLSNSPAYGAARIIDANSNLSSLFAGFSDNPSISKAASQTLPLLSGGGVAAASTALLAVNRVVQSRIEGNTGISSGEDFYGDRHLWLKPFGSWANQSDQNGVAGYSAQIAGMAVGMDRQISDNALLGISVAYAKANVTGNSSTAPARQSSDIYVLIGYGSYKLPSGAELSWQGDIGHNKNDGKRDILFMGDTASSSYSSFTAHAGLGVGKSFQLSDNNYFTPSARVDYTRIRDDGYSETGAGLLNLNVDGRTVESLIWSLDGKFSHKLDEDTSFDGHLGTGYDSLARRNDVIASFAGASNAVFTTPGEAVKPWLVRAGLGVTHQIKNGPEITARYDVEHRDGYNSQAASVKLRGAF